MLDNPGVVLGWVRTQWAERRQGEEERVENA